jgi:hypothetical protein
MPITDMTYEQMKKAVDGHVCGTCKAGLTIAWINNRYVIRCSKDLSHNTLTQDNKYPEYLEKEIYKEMTTQLVKMNKPKMLARIEGAKFPQQLTGPEKQLLATVALDYGLDPVMGELTIYQGKPFVSIDGRLRKAHETGEFEGIESRPASLEERKARGTGDGNKLWRSEVFKKGCSHGFVGWGEVRESEMKGNAFLPTVSWPDRMAEKRSQAMALRLAFYLPLPSFEDKDEPQAAEPPKPYIDSSAIEVKGEVSSQLKRDPLTVKTIGDLYNACLDDFKMQPADVLRELGISSKTEITDPADAYGQIASSRLTTSPQ